MLQPNHDHELHTESSIDRAVSAARGYRTLTGTTEDRHELEAYGFKPFVWDRDDAYPGLLIPMHNAHGEVAGVQFKPATARTRVKPNGERQSIKYETPSGRPLVVDVPEFTRAALTNLSAPLWITEGMKKTDALVSRGLAAVGLTGVFNWRSRMGTLGDWEDIPIKDRVVVLCFDADALENRNVQTAMSRLGAWLRSRGAAKVHYVVTPGEVDGTLTKGVDDFFAAGGDVASLAAAQLDSPPGQGAVDAAFTDAFLVEDLVGEALDGRFTWADGLGWLSWDGSVWVRVPEAPVLEAVRQWATGRFDAVLAEQAADRSKQLGSKITGWRGVLSRSRISALVALARGLNGVIATPGDFDADPDLFTVGNGTIHLPTGMLRPHSPADRITKKAAADYRPGYTHPLWEKVLEAVPEGSRAYLRDRLGQAITGYMTPDHTMAVTQGEGSNGKSTLTDLMLATLGDGYGVQISHRVLMANPGDHPTELMSLRGARYAVLEETPEARQLNVHRMKMTVGTPRMRARLIRENEIEWLATHSLFINTNYRPVVTETDHGTWRRLALLTFPFTFRKTPAEIKDPAVDRLGDPRLVYAAKDPAVRSAMLTWLAAGAQAFYQRDRMMLEPPAAVVADTLSWRAESDQVLGFANDCLTFEAGAFTPTEDMLTAFNGWLEGRGHKPWNAMTLGSRMGAHELAAEHRVTVGRSRVRGKQVRGWHGVRVVVSDNPFD